jgi:predicted DNA-binding transcriptional regulator AlpA
MTLQDNHTSSRERQRQLLPLAEVCEELSISRSTFYDWRQKGIAPTCVKLPNGELRIRRTILDAWLATREGAA